MNPQRLHLTSAFSCSDKPSHLTGLHDLQVLNDAFADRFGLLVRIGDAHARQKFTQLDFDLPRLALDFPHYQRSLSQPSGVHDSLGMQAESALPTSPFLRPPREFAIGPRNLPRLVPHRMTTPHVDLLSGTRANSRTGYGVAPAGSIRAPSWNTRPRSSALRQIS